MGKPKTKAQDVPDLTQLTTLTEDAITATLRVRFENDCIYTRINDSILVALNPYKDTPASKASSDYVAEYKEIMTENIEPLPPHVFQLANQAYLHMRRTGIDQSIILSGDTGSGKTEATRSILEHLIALTTHKKESKLQTQVMHAQFVLEAFGNAATSFNSNASRFGKYLELQFNERGRMSGAKTVNYLFEKKRVTKRVASEENFHAFYYLMAGATAEEKSILRLNDTTAHPYLNRLAHESEAEGYESLKRAMRSLGIGKRHQARIMQLLACLLHLGDLEFVDDNNMEEAASVRNTDLLELVADFLGVDPGALMNVFTYKTKMIKKDVTTVILNAEQASEQRDELVVALYSLLFSWIVEQINTKLCSDTIDNVIGILDLPAPHTYYNIASFDSFCINFAHERLHNYMLRQLFETDVNDYRSDGLDVPDVPYYNNVPCVELMERPKHGLVDIINHHSKSSTRGTDAHMFDSFSKYNANHDSFAIKTAMSGMQMFAIQHYSGQVGYNPLGFLESNNNALNPDFVSLFRGNEELPESYNSFLVGLFADQSVQTENHPKQADAILNAQQSNQPLRAPSMRRSKSTRRNRNQETTAASDAMSETKSAADSKSKRKMAMALSQLRSSLDDLMTTLDETTPWFIFCLRPSDAQAPNMFDPQRVRSQVRALGLAQIADRMQTGYTMSYFHDEFCERYASTLQAAGVDPSRDPREQCEAASAIFGWLGTKVAIGDSRIFMNETSWRQLEDQLRTLEKEDQRRQKEEKRMMQDAGMIPGDIHYSSSRQTLAANAAAAGLPMPPHGPPGGTMSVYSDDQRSFVSDDERDYQGGMSQAGSDGLTSSASGYLDFQRMMAEPQYVEEPKEAQETSGARKRWVAFVWFLTWWIPSKCLVWVGGMKRKDVRMAWREKLALCMLIFLLSAFIVWFLVGFGKIICPPQQVYSPAELQAHSSPDNGLVAIRGEVFDLTTFAPRHFASGVVPENGVLAYSGTDVSYLFPVQVSAVCQGTTGEVSPYIGLNYTLGLIDNNARFHDFRANTDDFRPDWYYEKLTYLRKNYKKGDMAYTHKDLTSQASMISNVHGVMTTRKWAVLEGDVFDLTMYTEGGAMTLTPPNGQGGGGGGNASVDFMDENVVGLFTNHSGTDITDAWNQLDLADDVRLMQRVCLRNLFYAGTIDYRDSAKCIFAEYLLLIVTVLLCLVIVFKFLAALQFGSTGEPELHDKFVICQVPCYTEDEDSIRRTIDSIAMLNYDDKRKLLFIICDGMIVGGGNDRPTPRIVLDILGVDPYVDPEPLSFLSVGQGAKQHNMGKVYAGLYEVHGHVVPYVMVAKVGKPSERQKPGNRGKRDSQLVLMRFLNKVHYNAPMTPMELEMYHQIKNVIGVNPSYYEFVLMVDADTEVTRDGLSRMVTCFLDDSRIIGLCGETQILNRNDSWVTMIQVYEYFISHYLIKAFESLFGTVTCLPGCFSMYRIRSATKNLPLLISNTVIEDYQINNVDTLHKKNLLFLGEDRYLTTLILKHFPTYKTKFTPDAKCFTNAPDQWSVLVSQRRRWINSTIHNLGELIHLNQLCGFLCFSMRFIVILDLISTLAQPAIVGYLVYLIYSLATSPSGVPLMTIITIAGVYGLQAVIFLLHRKWEHIVWMLVSICAIPVFSFLIPIYSYWHFDDFSWGNTRVVVGEKGQKKKVIADEGKFDPSMIPVATWQQYEEGLLMMDEYHHGGAPPPPGGDYYDDNASVGSRGSARSGYTYYTTGFNNPGSHGHYSSSVMSSQQPPPPPLPHSQSHQSFMAPPPQPPLGGGPQNMSRISGFPSHQSFQSSPLHHQ